MIQRKQNQRSKNTSFSYSTSKQGFVQTWTFVGNGIPVQLKVCHDGIKDQ